MRDCKEYIDFRAIDLMKEYPIKVIEDGSGFHVVNEPFKKVEGPFKTLDEAHKLLAEWWDEIQENSTIYRKE